MSRETILSFDPSGPLGKFTIVPLINVSATVLTSWSTCVTLWIPLTNSSSTSHTQDWGCRTRCSMHVITGIIYTMPFHDCTCRFASCVLGATCNVLWRVLATDRNLILFYFNTSGRSLPPWPHWRWRTHSGVRILMARWKQSGQSAFC